MWERFKAGCAYICGEIANFFSGIWQAITERFSSDKQQIQEENQGIELQEVIYNQPHSDVEKEQQDEMMTDEDQICKLLKKLPCTPPHSNMQTAVKKEEENEYDDSIASEYLYEREDDTFEIISGPAMLNQIRNRDSNQTSLQAVAEDNEQSIKEHATKSGWWFW